MLTYLSIKNWHTKKTWIVNRYSVTRFSTSFLLGQKTLPGPLWTSKHNYFKQKIRDENIVTVYLSRYLLLIERFFKAFIQIWYLLMFVNVLKNIRKMWDSFSVNVIITFSTKLCSRNPRYFVLQYNGQFLFEFHN